MKKYDVLGFGCATLDEMLFVEEFPQRDTKTRILSSEKQGGGLTATALVAAARLGARCAYAGQLGFDDISKFVAKTLETEGIDTSLIPWRSEAAAIRSLIVVDQKNATRNIFFERTGEVGAAPDAPTETEMAAARVLHIDHYGGQGNLRILEIARRHAIPVVADFERTNVPYFEEFLPLVDHLILSLDFATQLTGQSEVPDILRALHNEHRQAVLITCGAQGVWSLKSNRIQHFDAFPVNIVDTTGCGDVFHGVYAATLAWGFPLEKRILWSSAAAALKAVHIGAQKGIPTRAEIEQFLANQ
jgi:sugar/nucleoside kinase (ribokinase family)